MLFTNVHVLPSLVCILRWVTLALRVCTPRKKHLGKGGAPPPPSCPALPLFLPLQTCQVYCSHYHSGARLSSTVAAVSLYPLTRVRLQEPRFPVSYSPTVDVRGRKRFVLFSHPILILYHTFSICQVFSSKNFIKRQTPYTTTFPTACKALYG